jgi:hypothetical protein
VVPPAGKVGLLAKKRFSRVSSIGECEKLELQFGHVKTQLAIAELRLVPCNLTCGQTQSHTAKTSGSYESHDTTSNAAISATKTLITAWAFVFGSVALPGLFPSLATGILRRPGLLFIFLLTLVLTSFVYGDNYLYRQGMKRAKREPSDEDRRVAKT